MCNLLLLYVVSLFLFSTCLCRIFVLVYAFQSTYTSVYNAHICAVHMHIYVVFVYALHIYVLFVYVHFPTNRRVHIYVHEFYIDTSKKGIDGCTYMCKNARIQTALYKVRLYEPKSPY